MRDDLDDADDESDDEVEVMIVPKDEELERLGIDPDAFEEALGQAIDRYHEMVEGIADEDEVPPAEDMAVQIDGRSFRLGDLAEVRIANGEDFDESE